MMTMLPPDADRILMQWREGVLDLARSLRRIPGLPAEVAEGAEALEEARRLLDAVGIAAAPEDFALLALKERHLAVAVLTLLAHHHASAMLAALAEAEQVHVSGAAPEGGNVVPLRPAEPPA